MPCDAVATYSADCFSVGGVFLRHPVIVPVLMLCHGLPYAYASAPPGEKRRNSRQILQN